MNGEEEEAPNRCPVCLHELSRPTAVKQCNHLFCRDCIHKWCSSRRQPKCPLCQAEISVLRSEDGTEEEVKPPESLADEGPDLSCLDHSYFKQEAERLLRRAHAAQMVVTRTAYGSGRRGSAAADDATSALQQVMGALQEYRHDMEQEVPFDPEAVLHELYSLETIVSSVQAGNWASVATQEWAAAEPRLLSAEDAAGHGDDHDDYGDDYDDDPDHIDHHTTRRLDRAVLSATSGRRPVSNKGRRSSRGSSTPGASRAGTAGYDSGGGCALGRRK